MKSRSEAQEYAGSDQAGQDGGRPPPRSPHMTEALHMG
ncbi:hypothetical protein AGI3411_01255 [Achromobacter agilis]|uniref:Uncharacterized protein n=1 Tax=Achromobacter agilis TaxID=1353888 RepID=A0A446C741_9BURK|nr:hypothetical protein AGI3411_01255 [Achromobacter agilis]